jgi:hypothetical protein
VGDYFFHGQNIRNAPLYVYFSPDKKNLPPALPESEVHWYFYVHKERERGGRERERERARVSDRER